MQQPQAVSVSSPFQSWRASRCYKTCSFAHLQPEPVSKAACTECTRVQQTNLHALQFRHRASSPRSCCAFVALGTFAHPKAHSEASSRPAMEAGPFWPCSSSQLVPRSSAPTHHKNAGCAHSTSSTVPGSLQICRQQFLDPSSDGLLADGMECSSTSALRDGSHSPRAIEAGCQDDGTAQRLRTGTHAGSTFSLATSLPSFPEI